MSCSLLMHCVSCASSKIRLLCRYLLICISVEQHLGVCTGFSRSLIIPLSLFPLIFSRCTCCPGLSLSPGCQSHAQLWHPINRNRATEPRTVSAIHTCPHGNRKHTFDLGAQHQYKPKSKFTVFHSSQVKFSHLCA